MPAVKYDYGYYNRPNQGQAKIARPTRTYGNTAFDTRPRTSKATKNSVRAATSAVASPKKSTKNVQTPKRQNHTSIDIPIQVKKKVNLQKPEEMKLNRPKSYQNSHVKAESVLKTLAISTLMVAMLFALCVRYVSINEKSNKVNSLEKNLNTALALNGQLSSEIESKTNKSEIINYAVNQLGMVKLTPDSDQYIYIDYNKKDKTVVPEKNQFMIQGEEQDNFLTRLLNDLKELVD